MTDQPTTYAIGDRVKLLDTLPGDLANLKGRFAIIENNLKDFIGFILVKVETTGEQVYVYPREIEHVQEAKP